MESEAGEDRLTRDRLYTLCVPVLYDLCGKAFRPASNGKMALYYMEITAKTWISLSKGTKLLLGSCALDIEGVSCKNYSL